MSQTTIDFSSDPSGDQLLDSLLDPFQDNLLTQHSGTSRPSYAVAGTLWLDTTTTPWVWKVFNGTSDIILGDLDTSGLDFTPSNIGVETITGGNGMGVDLTDPAAPDLFLDLMTCSSATPATDDYLMFADTSDYSSPRKATVASVLALTTSVSDTNVVSYTSSTTYSKPSNLVRLRVQVIGGGGGGGGNVTSGGGSGGGGGAYAESMLETSDIGASVTITIGSGGSGGAGGGANNGSAGGTSSFGTHAVAGGGSGGTGTSGAATQAYGAAGGTPTAGQIQMYGGAGGQNMYQANYGGAGGANGMGGGGPRGNTGGAGLNGTSYGSGGAGGAGGSYAGGTGSGGLIILTEYLS